MQTDLHHVCSKSLPLAYITYMVGVVLTTGKWICWWMPCQAFSRHCCKVSQWGQMM